MASRWPYRVALTAALVAGTLLRVASLPLPLLAPRLPALLCGLTLLVWWPRVVARRLGDGTGLATAWLLALSPTLVTASRVSLPAAGSTLCASLAAVCFLRWWICGSRVAAGLFAPCAALTVACAPRAAPFVLASWIFGAGDLCVRPRTSARPKPLQLLVVALATAVAVALALTPGVAPLLGERAGAFGADGADGVTAGRGGAAPDEGLRSTWAHWVGTRHPLLALLVAGVALAGVALLWRRQRRLLIFSAVLVGTQVAVTALEPRGVAFASRGLLVTLPILVVWTAVALAEPWRAWRDRARARARPGPPLAQRT